MVGADAGATEMTRDQLTDLTEELRGLIHERLGIRARTFRRAVARAGRLLPAPARAAARVLYDHEQRLANPRLAARTDPAVARQAADTIRRHLVTLPAGQRRARARAGLASEIGFRIFAVIVLVILVLVWRGLL